MAEALRMARAMALDLHMAFAMASKRKGLEPGVRGYSFPHREALGVEALLDSAPLGLEVLGAQRQIKVG